MHTNNRGFTILELLVVIAIIGVLTALILASLTSSRLKADDVAIKGNLDTIKNQAELYFYMAGKNSYTHDGGGYNSASCDASLNPAMTNIVFRQPQIQKALEAINVAGGSDWDNTRCGNDWGGNSYAVAVRSRVDSTKWFCIDSKGANKTITTATAPALGGGNGVLAVCP